MPKRLGPPGHQYATVWQWRVPLTNLTVKLHHWYGSDDTRAYHSHPQWFATLVLWGGYEDHHDRYELPRELQGLPTGTGDVDGLGWLSFRFRRAEYRHYVVPKRNTWTLLLFGGPKRHWDFYRASDGKRFKRDKWFAEAGHHTQDGSPPVRLRPDGSVIGATQ